MSMIAAIAAGQVGAGQVGAGQVGAGQVGAGQKAADAGAQALENKKLVDASQQFEAVFLQELLKPMRAGSGADAESSEDADAVPGADTMASYGTEALAAALAKSGGMGIARQIVAKVTLEKAQHGGTQKAEPNKD